MLATDTSREQNGIVTVKTIEEAQALVGQTFGSGTHQRTVTRIEGLRVQHGYVGGDVYWKRPGGKERAKNIWLPYFMNWVKKAEAAAGRKAVKSIHEIEFELGQFPPCTPVEGFVSKEGNEVTISFKVLDNG